MRTVTLSLIGVVLCGVVTGFSSSSLRRSAIARGSTAGESDESLSERTAGESDESEHWPGVSGAFASRLEGAGFVRPTAIQAKALGCTDTDVVLHSPTGSGKSLAFLVPALADKKRVVVVVPSMELAVQLGAVAKAILEVDEASPLVIIADGSTLDEQRRLLRARKSSRVVIGTAKRLWEVVGSKEREWSALTANIGTLVVDEADLVFPKAPVFDKDEASRIRQEYNEAIVKRHASRPIVKLLTNLKESNEKPRLVLASATADAELAGRVAAAMTTTKKKSSGNNFKVLSAETAAAPAKGLVRRGVGQVRMPGSIKHKAYIVSDTEDRNLVAKATATALQAFTPRRAVAVVDDSASVAVAVKALKKANVAALALHEFLGVASEADSEALLEPTESRLETTLALRGRLDLLLKEQEDAETLGGPDRRAPILVTTASAARGLDLKNIDCVVLLDPPRTVDSYVHLAGRCGRQGAKGVVISILHKDDAEATLTQLKKELGCSFERIPLLALGRLASRGAMMKKKKIAQEAADAKLKQQQEKKEEDAAASFDDDAPRRSGGKRRRSSRDDTTGGPVKNAGNNYGRATGGRSDRNSDDPRKNNKPPPRGGGGGDDRPKNKGSKNLNDIANLYR